MLGPYCNGALHKSKALSGLPTIRPLMSLVDPLLQRLRHRYVTPISELKPRSVLAG